MLFNKPVLSIEDQILLMENRGLLIPDKVTSKQILSNINYHRLKAYMVPFQNNAGSGYRNFITGTSLDQIIDHYSFDRELRLLIFDAIERIEIAFRAQIIQCYSLAYGAWWFEDPSFFNSNHVYLNSLSKLDDELKRSQELFIDNYKNKYSAPLRPPSWISMEVTSLGLISKIYRELKICSAKKDIASHFGLGHPKILESWMQSFNYVRNVCAHHSRLFNRILTIKPTYPIHTKYVWLKNINFHHALNIFIVIPSLSLPAPLLTNTQLSTKKGFTKIL